MAEPKYQHIAEDLRRRIESGELPVEDQQTLPTEIELMEYYKASRNTVRDAISRLITRGLVETRAGQGTFVVEKINPYVTTLTGNPETGGGDETAYIADVTASNRESEISDPRVEIQKASRVVASSLRIEEGAPVVSRHQERSIDGFPWSMQTSFYPMALVERGATQLIQATSIEGGAVAYLAAAIGIQQAGYRDTIAVRTPNEDEVRFFKVPTDGRVPVFEIFRVGFDKKGKRIRLTVTVYPSDRNRLRIDVGAVPRREGHDGEHGDAPARTGKDNTPRHGS
jgi:GntR family transcriptional regulator